MGTAMDMAAAAAADVGDDDSGDAGSSFWETWKIMKGNKRLVSTCIAVHNEP